MKNVLLVLLGICTVVLILNTFGLGDQITTFLLIGTCCIIAIKLIEVFIDTMIIIAIITLFMALLIS